MIFMSRHGLHNIYYGTVSVRYAINGLINHAIAKFNQPSNFTIDNHFSSKTEYHLNN